MPVRTKRLYIGPTPGTGVWTPVYTAPAGETVILKHIVAAATLGTATSGFIRVKSGPSTEVNVFFAELAFPAVQRLDVWVVLQPGDQLEVWEAANGAWSWILSGAELEGVAD